MIDRAEIERAAVLFRAPEGSFERLLRRRDRKRRNQRIGAGALAIIIALVSFVALTRAFSASTRPADEPVPKPPGIFSGVGGWIVYGDEDGIWAVDPTRPDDPNSQIQLSTETGAPLAWSSDGSKLLILRRNSGSVDLFVLNADGTETYLATSKRYVRGAAKSNGDRGGSFSPDGSQVIYANRSSIYVVDAHGGTPRVLRTASRRWFDIQGLRVQALAYNPTYSPDGTQIAYFDGAGASREGLVHQLRVMNADGSDTRILVDDLEADTAGLPTETSTTSPGLPTENGSRSASDPRGSTSSAPTARDSRSRSRVGRIRIGHRTAPASRSRISPVRALHRRGHAATLLLAPRSARSRSRLSTGRMSRSWVMGNLGRGTRSSSRSRRSQRCRQRAMA